MKSQTTTCETSTLRAAPLLRCALLLALALAGSAACGGEASPEPAPNPAPAAKNEPTRFGKTLAEWLVVVELEEPTLFVVEASDMDVAAEAAVDQFAVEEGDAVFRCIAEKLRAFEETDRVEGVPAGARHITDTLDLLRRQLRLLGRGLAAEPQRLWERLDALLPAPGAGYDEKMDYALYGAENLMAGVLRTPGGTALVARASVKGIAHPNIRIHHLFRRLLADVVEDLPLLRPFKDGEPCPLSAEDARALAGDANPYAQLIGLGVLYGMGIEKERLVPALGRALRQNEDHGAQFLALQMIRSLGAEAAGAAPDLIAFLHAMPASRDGLNLVLYALYVLGPAARGAAEDLARFAGPEEKEEDVRGMALIALAGVCAPDDPRALALIEKAEASGSERVAQGGTVARIVLRHEPEKSAPEILETGMRSRYEINRAVHVELNKAPGAVRRILLEGLASEDGEVRIAAINRCDDLDSPGGPLIEALASKLFAEEEDERRCAIVALGVVGRDAAPALPALERYAAGADEARLLPVLEAYQRIGRPASAYLARLASRLPPVLVPRVTRALAFLAPDDEKIRDALLALVEESGHRGVQGASLRAVARMGPADKAFHARLEKLAQGASPLVRVLACNALRWTGGDPKPHWDRPEGSASECRARAEKLAAADLGELLWLGTEGERAAALGAFGSVHKADEAQVELMLNALRTGLLRDRAAARAAFGHAGKPAVKPLIEALHHREKFDAFGHRGVGGRRRLAMRGGGGVESYLKDLEEETDPAKRAVAARMLGGFGAKAAAAVGALAKAARDENDELAVAALEALGKIGMQETEAIAVAKEGFDNAKRVDAAAVALKALGGDPAPLLSARLERPLGELAVRCAAQMVKLDAKHARAHEVLQAALAKRGADWTPVAVEALLALDERRNATLSWLVDRLGGAEAEAAGTDWGFDYARGKLLALSYDSVAAVAERLKCDPNAKIRAECAALLSGYSPPLESALFKLPVAFKDADAEVRRRAVAGVRELLPRAYSQAQPLLLPLLPDFVPLVTDPVFETRLDAVTVFGLLKPATDEAVPPLAQALKDERAEVRAASAHALRQLRWGKNVPMSEEAMQALAGVFHDADAGVRREALFAAAEIDPEHRAFEQAADVLVELLESGETDDVDKERVCKILESVGAPAVGPLFDAVMRKFDRQK